MALYQHCIHRDEFIIQLYFLSTYLVLLATNYNALKQQYNNNRRFTMLVA